MYFEKVVTSWSIRKKLILLISTILLPGIFFVIYDSIHNFETAYIELIVLGVAAFFGLSAAHLIGDITFTRPINRLVLATERFGKGVLGVRTGIPHTDDEIGKLAQSFDHMATLLERRDLEKKKIEAELVIALRKNERILNAVEEGIIGLDNNGLVMFVNPAACNMLNYMEDELIGKDLHLMIHYSLPDKTTYPVTQCPMWWCLRSGESTRISDEVLWKKNGISFPAAYSVTPIIENDQVIGSVVTFRDISIRKQAEEDLKRTNQLIKMRLDLIEYSVNHTLDELLAKTLDEIGIILDSPIGFYHFVDESQETLSLQQWSTRTLHEFCHTEGKKLHYDISQAGVWADCIKEKRPVIHNDYNSLVHKKGLPAGHATIIRELVAPVIRENKVVAILGVGNRLSNYTEIDATTIAYLADVTWEIVHRKKIEASLYEKQARIDLALQEAQRKCDSVRIEEVLSKCDTLEI